MIVEPQTPEQIAAEAYPGPKLYLDDVRTPRGLGWTVVRSYDEAVDALSRTEFKLVSLDYDLGRCNRCWSGYPSNMAFAWVGPCAVELAEKPNAVCERGCSCHKTGMDVLRWMDKNNRWPKHVVVHSGNPHAAKRMEHFVRRRERWGTADPVATKVDQVVSLE